MVQIRSEANLQNEEHFSRPRHHTHTNAETPHLYASRQYFVPVQHRLELPLPPPSMEIEAHIIPIHNSGKDRFTVEGYCLVALTNVLCTGLEKILVNRLYRHLADNNLLD